jgi:hypothetical protein
MWFEREMLGPCPRTGRCMGAGVLRVALASLLLLGCAPPVVTSLRLKDPWQVAAETPRGRPLLSPGAAGTPFTCWSRDEEGLHCARVV